MAGTRTSAGTNTARELVIVLAVCAFLFFYGLGSFGMLGADEPRYTQIAREMLERGDWVTPTLGGKPWLEKPVLYYWGAMLSYSIFGVSDWAARVPSSVLSTLMVLAIYAFTRRFRPGAQISAALITAATAAFIGFGRAASTDLPLATTFTMALLAWKAWHLTARKLFLIGFYVALALATLAKGPVAVVLAGAVIGAFVLLRREWPLLWRTLWVPGALLYLALALPWYVAVELSTRQFFQVFIVEHNLARYGTDVFRHTQPFWYYALVLPVALLPWTAIAIAAVVRKLREFRTSVDSGEGIGLFLLSWLLIPVMFFSFSGSKLPGYILPAIPAGTMLAALHLHGLEQRGERIRLPLLLAQAILAGITLGVALLANFPLLKVSPTPLAWTIGIAAGLIAAVAVVVAGRRGVRPVVTATTVAVILGVAFIMRAVSPSIDLKESARPVANATAPSAPANTPVAGFNIKRELEYGLHFYRNAPVQRYERAEIPKGEHLLIMRGGTEEAARALLDGRSMTKIGGFPAQRLEFWRVGGR